MHATRSAISCRCTRLSQQDNVITVFKISERNGVQLSVTNSCLLKLIHQPIVPKRNNNHDWTQPCQTPVVLGNQAVYLPYDSNAAFLSVIELFCQWHYLPRDAKSLHQIPHTCLRHWINGLTEAYKKCCSGLIKVRHLLKNLSQGKDLVDSGKTRSKATGSIPAFAMQYIVDSKAKCGSKSHPT